MENQYTERLVRVKQEGEFSRRPLTARRGARQARTESAPER